MRYAIYICILVNLFNREIIRYNCEMHENTSFVEHIVYKTRISLNNLFSSIPIEIRVFQKNVIRSNKMKRGLSYFILTSRDAGEFIVA